MLDLLAEYYRGIACYPSVIEYVETYQGHKKCLLLKDNQLGDAFTVAENVVKIIAVKTPAPNPEPKKVNCAIKNSSELWEDVFEENDDSLKCNFLVLYNISSRNNYFLGRLIEKLLYGKSLFVVAILKKGVNETDLVEGVLSIFKVIDLAKSVKDIEVSEGSQAVEQESENEDVITIDHVRKLLKYKDHETRLEPKQIELFELLWENKDNDVGREEIYEKLWPGEEVSPIQIEQQINKLREGLDKLGFKKEIITTHKKSQLSEGAYTFHSDLTSFLKQP